MCILYVYRNWLLITCSECGHHGVIYIQHVTDICTYYVIDQTGNISLFQQPHA